MHPIKKPILGSEKFWSISPEDCAKIFNSDIEIGLSEEEAKVRLETYGRNVIHSERQEASKFSIFLSQLKSPPIIVLLIAGIITIFITHYKDSIFIFVAVLVNSILGFYQENKAEKAISALKTYLKQRARVVRSGNERETDAEEIVIGDIIRLSQGDRVPADARIVYSNDFLVDESILTGESLPETKLSEAVTAESVLADQTSMIFAGTLVTQGVCTALVCRTDVDTELGKIATLIGKSREEKTPLQKSITEFSVYLSIILTALTVVIFVIGISLGKSFPEMFLTSVAIAVSAIPEGLPISMTVILAVGVERMAKRKAVVRKLLAAEALGSTTIILTDKTGTITQAKMVLSKILPENISEDELLKMVLLNCNVLVENPKDSPETWRMSGRIMEVATVRAGAVRGITYSDIADKSLVLQSVPFNSISKFSVSLVKKTGKHSLIFFGAPDILISHSSLSHQEKEKYLGKIHTLASEGERILGVAEKEINHTGDFSFSKDLHLTKLSFLGLMGFSDPVRPGIKNTIELVKKSGVRTLILTGDHEGTAVAIAREIGLSVTENSVLDASELSSLSEEDLKERLKHTTVISRVTPTDKLNIAKLFQDMGEVVAMTGDGVNDAPSLKQANVGIAMGSGTEVAQSVSDLVLLDNNFETIVSAIEEGRQILANIRKVIVYLLTNVADSLILIGGSLVLGIPLPLNAHQILWVNFFTDSFPAVSFAFEKDSDALLHKPIKGKNSLFDPLMKFLIVVIGFSTSAFLFLLYYILLKLGYDLKLVQTFTFTAFGTYTLLVALSVKSLNKSIFSYSLFSNIYMTLGIIFGLALMALAVYLPLLQNVFDTVPLPLPWAFGVLLIGALNIFLIEISKYFFNKSSSKLI
ncbi:MAG: HAD-IC family P-type ATPase [Minisyncoccia bacterium]